MSAEDSAPAAEGSTYGLPPSVQLALIKKIGAPQAFVLLVLSLVIGALTAIAVSTGNALVSVPTVVLGLLVTFAYGRQGATEPVPRSGPLWDLVRHADKVHQARRAVSDATHVIADRLGLDEQDIRANVLAPDSSGYMLHPVHQLQLRLGEAELGLRIPEGVGCSGRVFSRREVVIAEDVLNRGTVSRGEDGRELVGKYSLGDMEPSLDPRLAWIIGAPIWNSDHSVVLGVLTIDGLASDARSIPPPSALRLVQNEVANAAAKLSRLLSP